MCIDVFSVCMYVCSMCAPSGVLLCHNLMPCAKYGSEVCICGIVNVQRFHVLVSWLTIKIYIYIYIYTCVPHLQTTDQHSPWSVSQATSLSASPPSPTPTKRAATSTRGAPGTSQWSTLSPLSRWSSTLPVGAVWSTPSTTWWGVWATSPLPPYSLATKGVTP